MTAGDVLRFAAEGISRAKVRAALTAAGVGVAITVLVLMVGFGAGVQGIITDMIRTEDTLTTLKVFSRHDPRWSRAPMRDDADPDDPEEGLAVLDDAVVAKFEALEATAWATRDVSFLALARRKDGDERKQRTAWRRRTQVIGLWPRALPPDHAERFAEGGMPGPDQPNGIVLTWGTAKMLRPKEGESVIGHEIVLDLARRASAGDETPETIEPPVFVVTGVLKNRQRLTDLISSFSPSGFGTRRTAYVWAKTAEPLAAYGIRGFLDMFQESGSTPPLPAGASSSATVKLHNPIDADRVRAVIEPEGFRVLYAGDVLKRVRVIFGLADGILMGLGAVALLVASLGIVNTMLMAVIERTREIGILKAIGARDRTIALLFICEAGMLGLLGGLGGAVLGLGVGELTSVIVNEYYIIPSGGPDSAVDLYRFPLWLWAAALGLAVGIAWVAALYPARRASRIDPVRALRYE
jgi:putative ABC transport system permease protein